MPVVRPRGEEVLHRQPAQEPPEAGARGRRWYALACNGLAADSSLLPLSELLGVFVPWAIVQWRMARTRPEVAFAETSAGAPDIGAPV